MKTFIWGDIESSGLGKNAGVVEVAWIETDEHFNIISRQSSLINPEVPIEFGAMGVHGITDAMVANAPTMTRFMTELGFPLAGDKVLCCHNVSFDQRFFGPWMDEPLQTLCTLKCSRVLYPDAENHKLQTLKFMFGMTGDHDKAHSALEDVIVMMQLAKQMCRDADTDLNGLLEVQRRPRPIKTMPFGKWKGTKLADVPKDYIHWLLHKADNLDADLRTALMAL
jgi:exodeoxyribonuclease X